MANQYQNGGQQSLDQPPPSPTQHRDSSNSSSGSGSVLGERRAAANPAFREKLRQMTLPLAPLVRLTTGEVHPAFPETLLSFWLLTDAQLEALAHFYHQRTPCRWTFHYPCPIPSWDPALPLEEKRRKIGRFIGLRGCESPIRVRSEDEILEEARRARVAEEEEMWRRKWNWY